MGTVYKVNCKIIKEIEVMMETFSNKSLSICFKDQPIRYIEDNTTWTGFLSQDGIIKPISELIPCNRIIQYIQLPNIDKTIVRQRHESFVASDSQLNYFNIDYLSNKIREPQLSHNSLLLDGIDLLSTFKEVVNHEM